MDSSWRLICDSALSLYFYVFILAAKVKNRCNLRAQTFGLQRHQLAKVFPLKAIVMMAILLSLTAYSVLLDSKMLASLFVTPRMPMAVFGDHQGEPGREISHSQTVFLVTKPWGYCCI